MVRVKGMFLGQNVSHVTEQENFAKCMGVAMGINWKVVSKLC